MTTAKKTTTSEPKKLAKPKGSTTPIPDLPNNPFVYEIFDVMFKAENRKQKKIEALQKYSRHPCLEKYFYLEL